MKHFLIGIAIICYVVAVAAVVEGFYKGIPLNGIITGAAVAWLGTMFWREKKYCDE